MLAIMDFAHAYKHIGVESKSTQFDRIAPSDPQGEIRLAYLNTQAFGSRRPPANWARVTQFVVFAQKKVPRVRMGIYVDDRFCLDQELSIEPARHVIKELCALLGMELAPDKEVPQTLNNSPWGANRAVARIRPRGDQLGKSFLGDRRN